MALIESHAELKTTGVVAVQNVLFATDFSATSEAALPYAAAICRRFGATLHVAHVLSDAGLLMMTGGVDYVSMGTIYEDAHTEAKEKLEQVASRVADIPHFAYVRHGLAWKNLVALVTEHAIDIIVVGTHGRSGFGKILLGSVAENILRHVPCPVLTVGPNVSGHAKLPLLETKRRDVAPSDLDVRQILFATNFSPVASRAARAAVLLAEEFRARLTLLHVIEEYTELSSRPGPIEEGLRRLQELIPTDAALQYTPERTMEFGSASEQILKVAAEREADMIVLGARPAAEVGTTHMPWSTAHYVITNAHCPVLTVRN
jgi:nucleotide-binding universal stress UspA family protein